ncbi:MAG TPA: sulfite exporter TauE/SafE family protein [Solirubrobacterales bacterium]|jgi:hypothetical protein
MSPLDALAVLAAALAAGAINAIVGSGSLITFPTLLAVGFAPVTANVSNTVGLCFGNFSAVWGYREELRGQERRAALLAIAGGSGAIVGGTLLLVLPSSVFDAIVPVLILLACALLVAQPSPHLHQVPPRTRAVALAVIAFSAGVYGGYFGAAAGVILLASLRLLVPERLQRLNGAKNLMVGTANGVAALLFVVFAHVAFGAAGLVAAGSIAGAQLGSRYGRRIPDEVLRWVVVTVGVIVAAILIVD